MPLYELILVLPARATPQRVHRSISNIGNFIVNRGGVLRQFRHLGVRHLGNKIRNHGKVISEGRYVIINAECSGECRKDLWPSVTRDDIIMCADMAKVAPPEVKKMRTHRMRKLLGFQTPMVADPVFDFPSTQEMRGLQYNAKRNVLEKMDKDFDPSQAKKPFKDIIEMEEEHAEMDAK